ncbi:hypothetical protein [Ensifer sp. SL37]|uniref:hypothetical protein n=1 Tax=Ensifer sp. SL37 TaxID=2995137 RepID=UPI002274CA14|nr:hypothetical protein [Ensifer sp. SL37]MCY1740654.1 hypothetical protein [Ensifer sp. SL37]
MAEQPQELRDGHPLTSNSAFNLSDFDFNPQFVGERLTHNGPFLVGAEKPPNALELGDSHLF